MSSRLLLFCFVLLFLLQACQQAKTGQVNFKKPEQVAKAFCACIQGFEFEKAKRYATESSKELLDKLNESFLFLPQADRLALQKEFRAKAKEACKSAQCRTDIASARCSTCCQDSNEPDELLQLRKIGQTWLVNYSRDAIDLESYGTWKALD